VLHEGGTVADKNMLAGHDTGRIAFDPTAPVPPLTDPNPDGYGPARLERLAVGLVAGLGEWVATPTA